MGQCFRALRKRGCRMSNIALQRVQHATTCDAGVTFARTEATLAIRFEDGFSSSLSFDLRSSRSIVRTMRRLGVQAVAIVIDGCSSAYFALSASIEGMPVALVLRDQLTVQNDRAAWAAAETLSSGSLYIRAIESSHIPWAQEVLLADSVADAVYCAEQLFQGICWPTI